MANILKQFSEQLGNNEAVKFNFSVYNPETNKLVLSLLSQALNSNDLAYFENLIIAFVRELIFNAVKANLKRAYFIAQKADITSSSEYEEKMQNFETEGLAKIKRYTKILQLNKLIIQFSVKIGKDSIHIRVANNVPMLEIEKINVEKIFSSFRDIESISTIPVFSKFEGAGMGLAMNLMLLKKTGIPTKNFYHQTNEKITAFNLVIPKKIELPDTVHKIQSRIVREISTMPMFPDVVTKILKLCDDVESHMSIIATAISKDPAITAGVIKLANSGGYITQHKVNSISDATRILGIRAIRNMTLATAVKEIMSSKYKVFQSFWDHAFKCAFYAKKIVSILKLKIEGDSVYLGGLLHDIGKIVLASIEPKIINELNGLAIQHGNRNTSTLEEISLGVSHSTIGAKLSQVWKFSDTLIEMIKYHHAPMMAAAEYQVYAAVVHLADALLSIETKNGSYVYVDMFVLDCLSLESLVNIEFLHDKLKLAFTRNEEVIAD